MDGCVYCISSMYSKVLIDPMRQTDCYSAAIMITVLAANLDRKLILVPCTKRPHVRRVLTIFFIHSGRSVQLSTGMTT